MSKQNSFTQRAVAFVSSPKFFWGIMGLLVLQAAWIALSGRYPMAFDEDFHLGLIRLYAHHWSPFWSAQPPGADVFGAVFRDPSYLYHYVMSFPYRLLNVFTQDQTIQVLWLRALNIGLFASGLTIYRCLLLKTGASRAIVHGCLLLFVLIPVVPLLAAQISYDNLFLPLIGIILLLVVNFNEELSQRKQINGVLGLGILILCLFTSLVKYAFLPIFIAIVLYLVVRLWQVFGSLDRIWQAKLAAMKRLSRHSGLLVAVGLVIFGGLFIERYGVNMVRYHAPVADCNQALSVEACNTYGPWSRDHFLEQHKSPTAERSPVAFAGDWLYGMWLRLFFTVDGPATQFQTKGPLVVPALSAVVFAGVSTVLTLVYARRLWREYPTTVWGLILLVTAVYISVLWLDGYQTFLRVGQAVAINGRYLLPVLPFLLLMGALGVNELCKRREGLKLLIGGIAVVCLLWGGGALTYILRSTSQWYWPNPAVRTTNQKVQNILGPLTPGYRMPVEFLR
jgi:hypothetical protein